jgi:predicted DNA-binding protein
MSDILSILGHERYKRLQAASKDMSTTTAQVLRDAVDQWLGGYDEGKKYEEK